ncbi:MAG: hypothetical protein ACK5N9_07640, partial [Pirellula sp.]
ANDLRVAYASQSECVNEGQKNHYLRSEIVGFRSAILICKSIDPSHSISARWLCDQITNAS